MVSLNKNDYNISQPPHDDGEIYPGSQPNKQTSYASFGSDKPYTEPQSTPLPEITPVHTAVPQGFKLCGSCEKLVPVGSVFCPACGNPTDGSSRARAQTLGRKYCPSCGGENNAESMFCGACGASLSGAPQPAPQPMIVNNYYTNNVNSGNTANVTVGGKTKNKWVAFLLCFFLGRFGIHKFYEGKILMGLLYLFTSGFLGVGWLIDTIVLLFKPNPYSV